MKTVLTITFLLTAFTVHAAGTCCTVSEGYLDNSEPMITIEKIDFDKDTPVNIDIPSQYHENLIYEVSIAGKENWAHKSLFPRFEISPYAANFPVESGRELKVPQQGFIRRNIGTTLHYIQIKCNKYKTE